MQRVALKLLFRGRIDVLNNSISDTCNGWLIGRRGAGSSLACWFLRQTKHRGEVLTTLFSNPTIITAAPIDSPAPRKKYGWLPLLTVLFLISYGLMTMLVIEQGTTIESQRALIRELFKDSQELSASRMKAQHEKSSVASPRTAEPRAQPPAIAQNPVSPLTQDHTPSSQALPQQGVQKQSQRPFRTPSRPASDLSDSRRALITI